MYYGSPRSYFYSNDSVLEFIENTFPSDIDESIMGTLYAVQYLFPKMLV